VPIQTKMRLALGTMGLVQFSMAPSAGERLLLLRPHRPRRPHRRRPHPRRRRPRPRRLRQSHCSLGTAMAQFLLHRAPTGQTYIRQTPPVHSAMEMCNASEMSPTVRGQLLHLMHLWRCDLIKWLLLVRLCGVASATPLSHSVIKQTHLTALGLPWVLLSMSGPYQCRTLHQVSVQSLISGSK
jgi:hypothetical protein